MGLKGVRFGSLILLAGILSGCSLFGQPDPPAPVQEDTADAVAQNLPDTTGNQTPTYTPIRATSLPTIVVTETPTPIIPTNTPTFTPSPLPTNTSTATATTPPTSTPAPTNTPNPTDTPPPGSTPLPTNTPIPVIPSNTPTPAGSSTISISPDSSGNRLNNPSFEGTTRWVGFVEINILEGWEPFYCSEPYVANGCYAPRPCTGSQTVGCNPPGNKMGRPEFKQSFESHRVHGGSSSQQWFCFWHSCAAGVYQTFPTTPGRRCEVGAYVYTWSNYDSDYASETDSQDDRDNSTWVIKVDAYGGTYAFSNSLLQSRSFTYSDGHYDNFIKISFVFTAPSSQATVFFENQRLWPITNNDSFVDDAYAYCE